MSAPRRHRRHIHAPSNHGEQIADRAAAFIGSWRFIIAQTVIVALWMAGNGWLLSRPFDPYPWILLNLVFSTQAAYTGPILLLASNRQAAKDRARDDHEAREVDQIMDLAEATHALVKEVHSINLKQTDILNRLPPPPA